MEGWLWCGIVSNKTGVKLALANGNFVAVLPYKIPSIIMLTVFAAFWRQEFFKNAVLPLAKANNIKCIDCGLHRLWGNTMNSLPDRMDLCKYYLAKNKVFAETFWKKFVSYCKFLTISKFYWVEKRKMIK